MPLDFKPHRSEDLLSKTPVRMSYLAHLVNLIESYF